MGLKVAIDLDGTISDFITPALKAIRDLYGVNLNYEDIANPSLGSQLWPMLKEEDRVRLGVEKCLYREICSPGFFMRCEPYPGAIEAVKSIIASGNEVFFLTMTPRWRDAPHEKAEWLKHWFSDVDYHTIMVDHASGKHLVNADIVIDDDPRVLDGLNSQIPICIRHPWNKDSFSSYWYSADNMLEAVQIVESIAKHRTNFDSLFC